MIYHSNEDKHAEHYVNFSNDLVGIFALSLGAYFGIIRTPISV